MSIIKHVTLQKIVAHDFRYDPRIRRGIHQVKKAWQAGTWCSVTRGFFYSLIILRKICNNLMEVRETANSWKTFTKISDMVLQIDYGTREKVKVLCVI